MTVVTSPTQVVLAGCCAAAALTVVVRRPRGGGRRRLALSLALVALAAMTLGGAPFENEVINDRPIDPGIAALQWLAAGGFFVVGVITADEWRRHRGRSLGLLALSVALISALAMLGQIWIRYLGTFLPNGPAVILLLASGYTFFLFRYTMIPARRTHLYAVTAVSLAATVVGLAVQLPASPPGQPVTLNLVQALDMWLIIGAWAYCVGEPCIRIWAHAASLPAVQRSRARALSGGYGMIVFLLIAAVAAASAPNFGDQLMVAYVTEIVVLCALPLIYAGLVPPPRLRRFWRESEEEEFRHAVHDLLLGAPDASTLAARCLDWAVRLVGAEAGCIVGLDGEMLATSNLSQEQALMLAGASHHAGGRSALRLTPESPASNVIVVPMTSDFGKGAITVVAGRFTPVLGSDEVNRLTQYAASVTAAFDRLILLDQLQSARNAAERASRRKSEHLSRMSHELRTPMSAILGFADLLSLNNPREDQRHDIDMIMRAADHLLALINEVLEIALIESGRGSLSREPIRVRDVARDAMGLVQGRARAEQVALVEVLDPDAAWVLADNQRLRQVLVNLLSNAVKYNRAGGSVELRARRRDDRIRFEVRDTGSGIEEAKIGHLFEPFERLGAERTQVEGTGLGLALSKALIEAMDGTIGVVSAPGEGTTFWVELARSEPVAAIDDETETTGKRSAPRRELREILYVEDNLSNVELVDRVLSQQRPHLHMVALSRVDEAMEWLSRHTPGMILLDLHLADLDGDVLLAHVRADARFDNTPVVMLSADATEAQIERLMASGANDYLTKPFRVKSFLATVDAALARTLVSSRTTNHASPRETADTPSVTFVKPASEAEGA